MTSCMLPHLFLIRFSLVVSCMLGLRFFASAKLIASHRGKYFRTIASVVSTASSIYFSWRSQTVVLACSWPLSSKLQPTNHIIPTPPPEWSNDVINNLESIELWWTSFRYNFRRCLLRIFFCIVSIRALSQLVYCRKRALYIHTMNFYHYNPSIYTPWSFIPPCISVIYVGTCCPSN